MRLGEFELNLISDGSFRLDGGAMFGVVPKLLWEKKMTPDVNNRIRLGLNCLLVRTREHTILIDTGCGDKYTEKEIRIYQIERKKSFVERLGELGVSAEDVDFVVNTHLHFDHCGGNTRRENGRLVPTFPNASYIVRRQEYLDASNPSERTVASYFERDWKPLRDEGLLRMIDEDEEILPGIELVHTPGHTAGHQSVLVRSGEQALFYLADLCPTPTHVHLPWVMGYDLYPVTTMRVKKEIFRRAMDEDWLLFFEHEPECVAGRVEEVDGRFRFAPVAAQW